MGKKKKEKKTEEMGNANGREEGANGGVDDLSGRSNGGEPVVPGAASAAAAARVPSSDSMAHTPPQSPRRSRSPLLFAPQVCIFEFPLIRTSIFSFSSHLNYSLLRINKITFF